MCGIVGYFGLLDARDVVLSGLEKLEYRGYDSAGIALVNKNNELEVYKDKGRVAHLKAICDNHVETHLAIGHTRWATHGVPNKINAHPHCSENGRYTIVHNGVIENYKKLKVAYLSDFHFKSETDTEVIANLIEYFSKEYDSKEAILQAISLLEGSYALLIIDNEDKDKIYIAKNKTPLIIGIGESGITIGSDVIPLVGYATEYVSLPDLTFGYVTQKALFLFDLLNHKRKYKLETLDLESDAFEKGNYPHFMLKEIHEQPSVIRHLISQYFEDENINIDPKIIQMIRKCNKINLVACGTSMYASYMAKYYFEKLCRIPSEVFVASELVYSTPLILDNPCFIFLSQSGETADSIAVMKKFKDQKYPIISITNIASSTMANLSDYNLNIFAGSEIAVASTKAYVAQIVVCAILAKAVSNQKTNLKNNLSKVALAIEKVLSDEILIKAMAKKIMNAFDIFYIGRGIDYWVCLEAALKLKEISYIHTEAFSSGELKHGSIALIDHGTPVIAICTQEGTNSIVRNNLTETKSRGAHTFVIAMESMSEPTDDIIIPNVAHYLSPLVSVVVCQLLAYHIAALKGNDVDKPKNLAKSVTVE